MIYLICWRAAFPRQGQAEMLHSPLLGTAHIKSSLAQAELHSQLLQDWTLNAY